MLKDNSFTVADYLLTRLRQLGLGKVFQVPGDYVSEFMEALEKFDGVDAVGDINELGAGYAADGYARFAGIGAVSVQYGVGTFSVLNAVAGSYVERNPVVVVSASPSAQDRLIIRDKGVLFHHSTGNLNADKKVFEQVTVAAEVLSNAAEAPLQIDRALTAAISKRRPIYLEAWQNVWGEPCREPEHPLRPQPPVSDRASLRAVVDETLQRLVNAKRGVIMLGIEIARYGLQEQALRMVEASGLPFTTTLEAKSVLDESHPQFIGTYAGAASCPGTREYMKNVDCILALGVIFTDDYLDLMQSDFSEIILVNDEQVRVGYEYFRNVAMTDYIDGLSAQIKSKNGFPHPLIKVHLDDGECAGWNTELGAQLTYNIFFDQLTHFFQERRLQSEIELILGESSSLYVASNINGLPQNSFIADAVWGSLGHETGCAIGVAMASGKRPYVVAGDGGFMMMCQSLSTLARNRINAVVFVMSNGVYAIEQAFVDIKAFTPEGRFAPFDILPQWDYQSLAKAYGAMGYRAQTIDELQKILLDVESLVDCPALVEIVIPQKDLAPQIRRLAKPS
ncbi:alpha-keto acid decarboxylase family protein [Hahella sp. HN01]|uniref:alpha-keto acid decarboxylase family protein n=1 Tax=unclassified Hahella TaxID=2624107 RepID=UPI001C1E9587|nr:thiamine pyrophosphate-binding protein [Hahella sp. HN01]MBU6953524.1 alpha-keto acid decarboxylase family protein [Hahella sp. HN01]